MATTIEGKISAALKARTVDLATALTLPLSWDGWDFNIPDCRRFLRAEHRPNVTNRRFIGSNDPHQYLGLLQISVHYPHGTGEPDLRDVAGQIVAYFPCDLRLTEDDVSVRIMKRPEAPGFVRDDQDMQIPVMIEYECWA